MQLGIGLDIRRVWVWFTCRLPWSLPFPHCSAVCTTSLSGVSHRYLRREQALYLVPWFNLRNTFQHLPPPRMRTTAGWSLVGLQRCHQCCPWPNHEAGQVSLCIFPPFNPSPSFLPPHALPPLVLLRDHTGPPHHSFSWIQMSHNYF